jgi:hypothetical protein
MKGLSPNLKAWIRDVGRSPLDRDTPDADNDEAWGSLSRWETRRSQSRPDPDEMRWSVLKRSQELNIPFS